MPKIYPIGNDRFFQVIDFPVVWGTKFVVRGWTQEIDEPFRHSKPLIFRLPFHKAFVVGRWQGITDEETALNRAIERRDVTYDDFREEAGWTPAPSEADEEDRENLYP